MRAAAPTRPTHVRLACLPSIPHTIHPLLPRQPQLQHLTHRPSPRWTSVLSTSPRLRPITSTVLCVSHPFSPGFRVLLVRRSRPGHVYAGQWGVISGSIEASDASPLEAALREVREETGLVMRRNNINTDNIESPSKPRTHLGAVLLKGLPFDIVDNNLATPTTWRIHPFLIELALRESDTPTWEAGTKYARHAARRVLGLPGLVDVWPRSLGAQKRKRKGKAKIKRDWGGEEDPQAEGDGKGILLADGTEAEFDDVALVRPFRIERDGYKTVEGLVGTLEGLRDQYLRKIGRAELAGRWRSGAQM